MQPNGGPSSPPTWCRCPSSTTPRPAPDSWPSAASLFDPHNSAATSTLIVPEVVVGRRHGRSWLTRIGTDPNADLALPPAATLPRNVTFADGALTGSGVGGRGRRSGGRINLGTLDKVVLARDLLAFADERDRSAMARRRAGRALRAVLDVPDRRLRRGHARDADPPRGRSGDLRVLAGTIRRTGDRIGDLRSPRRWPVQQGSRGARVRGALGRRALSPSAPG